MYFTAVILVFNLKLIHPLSHHVKFLLKMLLSAKGLYGGCAEKHIRDQAHSRARAVHGLLALLEDGLADK